MKMANGWLAALVWFLILSATSFADGPADTFVIHASADRSLVLTAGKLKSDFAKDLKSITYTSRGQSHTANAVSLLDILRAAGVSTDLKMDPKADPKTKNAPLRETVLVTGRDGYSASFSLGELLPDIGNREAWIAIDQDGAPLTDRYLPVELIVPQDVKPGRWVRGVASITVESPTDPTTRP